MFAHGLVCFTMNTLLTAEAPAALEEVAGHPFLRGLSRVHLQTLADCAMHLHFEAGQTIFNEGDPANRFYLLIKGKVQLAAEHEGGRNIIGSLGGGEVLGWSWLFPPYYTHFSATAEEPTEAMFFYGTRLRELCEEDHELGYQMLSRIALVVVNRLVSVERQLAAVSAR